MEIIFDSQEEVTYRFQSDCGEPGCAIDVTIQKDAPPEHPFIELDFWDTANRFPDRLRWCWRMLTQGLGFRHEFFVRGQDIDDFAQILRRAKRPFRRPRRS